MRRPELAALGLLALLSAALLPGGAAAHQASTTPDGIPLQWWSACVYWTMTEQSVDNSGLEDPAQSFISYEELREAVRGAFAVWGDVGCSYLTFIETEPGHCMDVGLHRGSGNANRVMFRSSGWVDPDAPWRVEDQIALTSVFYDTQTGEILDVDIEVNADINNFELSTTTLDPRTDIQNALAHEVGHLVGLDHSEVRTATMWATARLGELDKRELDADDVAGICSIYPLEDDPGRCDRPPGGLDVDCETADSCAPAVDGIVESCWYDELVCCCDEAGGLGRCEWTESPSCAAAGRHGVLQIDDNAACGGERPGAFHTCCCHVEDDGAVCEWRPFAECEEAAGLPSVAVTAEVLCGPYPDEGGCGCRAPGAREPTLGAILAALLPGLF